MVLGNKFCTNPFKNCFSWCPKITIVLCTVVCLVAKPLNRSEAEVDFVLQIICYRADWILVSITTRSYSASFQIKGLATKYTTVKWPIAVGPIHNVDSFYELVKQQMPFEVNDEMVQNLPFWMVNCTI